MVETSRRLAEVQGSKTPDDVQAAQTDGRQRWARRPLWIDREQGATTRDRRR